MFMGQIEIDLFTLHVSFSKCNMIILQRVVSLKFLSYLRGYVRIVYERQGWESLETIQTKEVYYHC